MPRSALFLVTGGCGFIGSHLVDALLEMGHRVRVLDDLSTGKRSNIPEDRVELIVGDVADAQTTQDAMVGVDGCFHLAAVASVQRSNEDWVGAHLVNLTGTIAVFNAARHAKNDNPIPVVYASSAAVYGDNADLPLSEIAIPRPMTSYGADKLGSEQQARVAGLVHTIPTAGFRFFNVYGPRQDPASPYSGVISIFAQRLASGNGITIFGDGQQTRDFVYVGDVVCHLIAGMKNAAVAAPVYNVCTGRATTVLTLANTIAELLQVEPDIRFDQPRPGDIRHSLGDPTAAKMALSVQAQVSLDQGLGSLLETLNSGADNALVVAA
ncbi:MAG: NAD-dependent epimerase/dehydratase family protein [Alphaproteobacteria bacterium]|nr:NAD-dependent epimerase/dehydratase family protein [Alphaproteobacteria bacterium]MCB9930941.1 NAD-dependent epimerase/dehydratase family protein [Alphaproteobacteria bacterium]